MQSVKKTIQSEEELVAAVEGAWGDLTNKLQLALGEEYTRVKKYQKTFLYGIAMLIFLFLAGTIIDSLTVFTAIIGFFVLVFPVPFLVFVGIYTHKYMKTRAAYTRKLNKFLFPFVCSVLGFDVTYRSGNDDTKSYLKFEVGRFSSHASDPDYEDIKNRLDHSELLTERISTYIVDDIIDTASFNDQQLTISELRSTRTEGSGKSRRTVTVFQGVFVDYKLPKSFSGVTFVSTEGDRKGYGHRDFWSSLAGTNKVKETVLEWNRFERDLHVATTDGTEARYILTPDFMESLYNWWSIKKRNIRIVFREDHLYLLFPDNDVRFSDSVITMDTKELQKYVLTIATPFWYVLKLIEVVNRRFD